jgi:predicted nucleic-acid-binding protein
LTLKRIGVDANILLRALLNDHPQQSAASRKFLAGLSPDALGYVGISAMMEIFWVLNGRNRVPRGRVAAAIDSMLSLEHVEYEGLDCIRRAIGIFAEGGVDFPDVLLAERNKEAGCAHSMTFDQKAAARIPGMELLT